MTTYEAERDEQLFSLFALSVSELSIFFCSRELQTLHETRVKMRLDGCFVD